MKDLTLLENSLLPVRDREDVMPSYKTQKSLFFYLKIMSTMSIAQLQNGQY